MSMIRIICRRCGGDHFTRDCYTARTLKGATKKVRQLKRQLLELNKRVHLEDNKGETLIELDATDAEGQCDLCVGQNCVTVLNGCFKVDDVATALVQGLGGVGNCKVETDND